MHSLNVDVEVFVLELEAVNHKRNGIVAELNQLRKTQIQEAAPQPQDEFYQLKLGVDGLLKQEVESEGVGQTECELEHTVLQDVAVDVEGVVPIVIHDERVDQCVLLNAHYRD